MVKSKELKRLSPTLVFYFNIFLQLVLFVIFLVFFGIPSVSKYLDRETIVIYSEEETHGIESPAITFLALKNHMGWKSSGNITYNLFNIVDHCKKIGLSDIGACALNDTYGLGDFMTEFKFGAFETDAFLSESSESSLWTEDLTSTPYGRHFTLKLGRTINRKGSNFIIFKVDSNPALHYSIWVHDENFFLLNINPFRESGVKITCFHLCPIFCPCLVF